MPSGLLRVSVVAGNRRVDLAVPGAVPVAELLPEIARSVGLLDPSSAYAGHRVLTADGRTLSTGVGLAGQGVPDGGLLTVVGGAVPPPPTVQDDPAEAVCEAVGAMATWPASARRAFAIGAGGVLLLLGAATALAARQPILPLVTSAALCATAITLARVRADVGLATGACWLASAYAAVAGALLAPPAPALTVPLAAAGGGAAAAGLACMVGFRAGRVLALPPVLVGGLAIGVGLGGRTLGAEHAPDLLMGVLVLVVLVAGAMPWLAVGAVRTDPAGADVRLAHELLLALGTAVGALLVLSAPVAAGHGLDDTLLVTACAALCMLRARHCRSVPEVLVAWVSGVVALAVLATVGIASHPGWRLGESVLTTLAGAGVLLAVVAGGGSVRRAHAADVAEPLAVMALLPLLVVVVGLPGWVEGLVG